MHPQVGPCPGVCGSRDVFWRPPARRCRSTPPAGEFWQPPAFRQGRAPHWTRRAPAISTGCYDHGELPATAPGSPFSARGNRPALAALSPQVSPPPGARRERRGDRRHAGPVATMGKSQAASGLAAVRRCRLPVEEDVPARTRRASLYRRYRGTSTTSSARIWLPMAMPMASLGRGLAHKADPARMEGPPASGRTGVGQSICRRPTVKDCRRTQARQSRRLIVVEVAVKVSVRSGCEPSRTPGSRCA